MFRATCVVIVALAAGCTATYRTTSGAATAYPGMASGRTGSIVLGDRGGLTRIGLGALGAAFAGFGSIKEAKRETTIEHNGDQTVIHQKDTIVVDPEGGKGGMQLVDLANDPNSDLSSLASTLEIASRDLGGDTSGWMFKLGAYAKRWRGRVGLRAFAGLGFGHFTFHDRQLRTFTDLGAVSDQMGDWGYSYFGTPARVGLMLRRSIDKPNQQLAAEIFAQGELNWVSLFAIFAYTKSWSPSPWTTGLRLSYGPVFVEGSVSTSTMRASATSLGLEAGIDF